MASHSRTAALDRRRPENGYHADLASAVWKRDLRHYRAGLYGNPAPAQKAEQLTDALIVSHGKYLPCIHPQPIGGTMSEMLRRMWSDDEGQDIAEYAVMLAVILVIVVGTIKLIGSNANNVFSNVASSIH